MAVPGSFETKSNDGSMSPPVTGAASSAKTIQSLEYSNYNRLQRNRQAGSQHHDDAASVASIASMSSDVSTSCTHARMKLFPLYVSEVHDKWPESGRARKVLDIDAAIAMMESRPEFRTPWWRSRNGGCTSLGLAWMRRWLVRRWIMASSRFCRGDWENTPDTRENIEHSIATNNSKINQQGDTLS